VPTNMLRLGGRALIGRVKEILETFRRAGERRRLSELTPLERRDLGLHQVREELNKWPWEH
jgi:hypothetical protein